MTHVKAATTIHVPLVGSSSAVSSISSTATATAATRPRFVLRRERDRLRTNNHSSSSGHTTTGATSASIPPLLYGYAASNCSGTLGHESHQRWPSPRPLLRSVFFAEFDNKVGPKITYQTPRGFMSAELFDEISDFMITSPELCHKLITIHAFDLQVLGYPMYLENKKFARNAFFFNVGFSLDASATPDQALPYHAVLCKLAAYVETLEVESEFLYKEASKVRLEGLLQQVFNDLNQFGECSLAANAANIINLKLSPVLPVPRLPLPHEVPVRLRSLDTFSSSINQSNNTNNSNNNTSSSSSSSYGSAPLVNSEWDLGVRELLPYIDGISCCARIAHQSQVSIHQVLRCIRQLLYYGCVALTDIFQYTNVYVPTAHVSRLLTDETLHRAICRYCVINTSLPPPPLDLIVDLFVLQLKRAVRVSQLAPSAACDILHASHIQQSFKQPIITTSGVAGSDINKGDDGHDDDDDDDDHDDNNGESKTVHYGTSHSGTGISGKDGHVTPSYVQPLPAISINASISSTITAASSSSSQPVSSSLLSWYDWNVDIRRLLSYGVINGLIRRVHRYPIINRTSADAVPPPSVLMLHVSTNPLPSITSSSSLGGTLGGHNGSISTSIGHANSNGSNDDALAIATSELERMLDGQHSFDEICSRLSMTPSQLEAWLRADNRCVIITR